jgi:hypothetical protein
MSWFSSLQPPVQAAVVSAAVSAVVTLAVAALSPFAQRGIERLKGRIGADTERLKAQIAEEASVRAARQSYEFDARKRLYAELEPLLFQLFEASENSYYRVVSLVRTHRYHHLGMSENSWLTNFGYYYLSTIFRLFLPIAIYRLIQRSATFVDLKLDSSIRTRYLLMKLSYLTFTDDFVLASQAPPLAYSPEAEGWKELRIENPAVHWRQGAYLGLVDRIADGMIVTDSGKHRAITYGEFENKALKDKEFQAALGPMKDIFLGFDFPTRPVLSRILFAHACLMRLVLHTYARPSVEIEGLVGVLISFVRSPEAQRDLAWWDDGNPQTVEAVLSYLTERIAWLEPEFYAFHATS